MRIIGIGSVFNDDNIAWRCLQQLEPRLTQVFRDTEFVYCESPATQLIHQLEPAIDTILVDALLSDSEEPSVQSVDSNDLYHRQILSSHNLSVAHVLQLAGNLKTLPHNLYILGIGIDPHAALPPHKFTRLVRQLEAKIGHIITERNTP